MARNSDSEKLDVHYKVMVSAGNLAVGMYVCELDRPWLESPFRFQGFMLLSEDDVLAVRELCDYVYIDTRKTVRQRRGLALRSGGIGLRDRISRLVGAAGSAQATSVAPDPVAFEDEFQHAQSTYRHSSQLVKTFMEDIRFGRGIDITLAKEAVSDCVNSICRNSDAMLLLTQLKRRDEYTSQHSMNVCIFSIAFGRHLGLPVPVLRNLGLCGLLHDMGKMRVPLEILNKPGRFTEEEFAVMKAHTVYGREILASCRDILPSAVDVAHAHHERIDGQGYPRALNRTQTSPITKMVSVVDAYDAITSDRVYQKGRAHLDAIGILNKAAGSQFDSELVSQFIDCLGIYPAGSLVEMSNGEVALVVDVNPRQKLRPKVLMLLDAKKRPQTPRIVDLADVDADDEDHSYRIAVSLPNTAFGLNVRSLYEQGLLANLK